MSSTESSPQTDPTDVVLIGGGIMSATLGALLTRLEPDFSVEVFERLEAVALESSAAWNNAGPGHSALLGASSEASTAVPVMLRLLQRCFPERMAGWRPIITELVPSYGRPLTDDPALLAEVRSATRAELSLVGGAVRG